MRKPDVPFFPELNYTTSGLFERARSGQVQPLHEFEALNDQQFRVRNARFVSLADKAIKRSTALVLLIDTLVDQQIDLPRPREGSVCRIWISHPFLLRMKPILQLPLFPISGHTILIDVRAFQRTRNYCRFFPLPETSGV